MTGEDRYGIRSVQELYLTMLRDVDAFCRERGIRYSLSGGTLLGAVRHQGFIPWDDDADVMFDRPDYERFLREVSAMEGYEILGRRWTKRITPRDETTPYKDRVCLDLFVLDGVPENAFAAKLKVFLLLTLQGMLKVGVNYGKYSLKQRLLVAVTHVLGLPFSRKWKQNAYDAISRWGGDGTRFVNVYNTRANQVRALRFPREMMDGYVDMAFEGERFMAFRGWEEYLRELYGDYMTLPPEAERGPAHRR